MYIIRGVRTAAGGPVDLIIRNGVIDSIIPSGRDRRAEPMPPGALLIPGEGLLVLPGFVDLHIHLDKAFLRDELPEHDGTLAAAIRAFRERKARYTPEDVEARAVRLIRSSVAAGTTKIRTHVDIDSAAGLVALQGIRRARAACSGLCEIQIVAFPQEGLISDPGAKRLMEQAVAQGVDAVGGIPHWEADPDDQRAHVRFCFDLAGASALPVDMHVDESDDGNIRTLEMVVDETVSRGWEGRVTVGHVCALAAADHEYAARVIAKCRAAAVTVVSNPTTNLFLQGRHDRGLIRRGTTRISEFRAAGVNLCFGQDNIVDAFYPFGRGDMLEVAFVSAHAAHLSSDDDLRYALDCITEAPATAWGVKTYGVRQGVQADLALYRAGSWPQVLQQQRPPELVFYKGDPVARSLVSTMIGRDEVLSAIR